MKVGQRRGLIYETVKCKGHIHKIHSEKLYVTSVYSAGLRGCLKRPPLVQGSTKGKVRLRGIGNRHPKKRSIVQGGSQ